MKQTLCALCILAVALLPAIATTTADKAKDGPVTFTAKVAKDKLFAEPTERGSIPFPDVSDDTYLTPTTEWAVHFDQRKRPRPMLSWQLAPGASRLEQVHIDFGRDSFAVPAFTLTVKKDNGVELFKKHVVLAAHDKGNETHLELPDAIVEKDSAPDSTLWEIVLDRNDVTDFVYEFPTGIPQDIIDSKAMYDLVPHNTTMGVKFLIKVDQDANRWSFWVTRKPPMPDFEVMFHVNGSVWAAESVQTDPQTTDAQGFDLDMGKESWSHILDNRILIIVRFFEHPRQMEAVAVIDNMRATIDTLTSPNHQVNPSRVIDTNIQGLQVRLDYNTRTRYMGLRVLQPYPISSLLLTLYRVDKDGNRMMFLREDDEIVPFYDSKSSIQYGWDDAIPVNASATMRDDVDLFNDRVEVVLKFNQTSQEEQSTGRLLSRWIENQGGNVSALDLSYLGKEDHSKHRKHPLRIVESVAAQQIIAHIPYAAILTHQIIERSPWSEIIKNVAGDVHEAHRNANNLGEESLHFLQITAAILLHLYEETHNFRVYFDTFRVSSTRLPVEYSEEEMMKFHFDPHFQYEVERMKQLWEAEYNTLKKAESHLPRTFSKEDYFRVRSQVETRMLNLSSTLVLAPVLDLLCHDDAPNSYVHYNDTENVAFIVSLSNIPAKSGLTVDFGKATKTKLEFLLQFGFVPPGALDAVVVNASGTPLYLTSQKSSRDLVLQALAGSNVDDEPLGPGDLALQKPTLKKILDEKLARYKVPTPGKLDGVDELADRLMQSERAVVMDHIKWLQDDEREQN